MSNNGRKIKSDLKLIGTPMRKVEGLDKSTGRALYTDDLVFPGMLHGKITNYFLDQQKDIENNEIRIVAYNDHKSDGKLPPIDVFRYPEGVEEAQKERLRVLKEKRDNHKVKEALSSLKEACVNGENIVPFCVACARARCTEGEMFKVFKEAYGMWRPPIVR